MGSTGKMRIGQNTTVRACEAIAEGKHSRRGKSIARATAALVARGVIDQALCASEWVVVIGYDNLGGILELHPVALVCTRALVVNEASRILMRAIDNRRSVVWVAIVGVADPLHELEDIDQAVARTGACQTNVTSAADGMRSDRIGSLGK